MLDPKKVHNLEQGIAQLSETIPPLMWNLYKGFLESGFTDEQSMALILKYLECVVVSSVIAPPDEDDEN